MKRLPIILAGIAVLCFGNPARAGLPAPNLLTPGNGSSLPGPPYNFTWQAVSGVGLYQIKIANNTSFTNPVINYDGIASWATSYQTSATLSFGQAYYWQMRTLNSTGTEWGPWGQYRSFTPTQIILPAPNLQSPGNGASVNGPPYTFSWSSVSGAGAYHIKIATNSSFSNTVINYENISGSATSYQTSYSFNYGQTYYWQMRTLNSSGTDRKSVV